jgi:hypothetical protein
MVTIAALLLFEGLVTGLVFLVLYLTNKGPPVANYVYGTPNQQGIAAPS